MAELPDYAVWLVVGAIVTEGVALVVLTYLMYRAAERRKSAAGEDEHSEATR